MVRLLERFSIEIPKRDETGPVFRVMRKSCCQPAAFEMHTSQNNLSRGFPRLFLFKHCLDTREY